MGIKKDFEKAFAEYFGEKKMLIYLIEQGIVKLKKDGE